MKAITRREYGSPDVLELEEIERPKVGESDVLVKVHPASANASDIELLTAHPLYVRLVGFGFRRPKVRILGSDVAGRVEAVGAKVTRFRPGDEVLADTFQHGLAGFAVRPNEKDLATVTDLVAQGRLRPVIDRRYPLREAAEALRCLGSGQARGKVVVTM